MKQKHTARNFCSALVWLLILAGGHGAFCADVVVNQAQTFQTISGWGHGGGVLGGTVGASTFLAPAVADPVNYQYLNYLVDDLCLTGSRMTEVGPRIDGTANDHGDCDVVDWNLFESDTLSTTDATYLAYYQNRIQSKGYPCSLYSSTGYPSDASDSKPWVLNHPGERAQQMWANALYLKNTYGINISYAVLWNEPSLAVTILSDDLKAVGPRLVAQGLSTLVQYAEAVAPQPDWNYITPVENDPNLWPYVGRISYHDYGTADPYRSYLQQYATARGLTTAQTEMGNPTFDDLYSDLTLAGVSYWEVAYSGNLTLSPNSGLTTFVPSGTYFRLRQVMHYVHPGAVRIGAAASDPSIRSLAFVTNGLVTTIIENTASSNQTVNLSGLPPGTYGLSQSASGASAFQEFGMQTVGAGGTLSVTVSGGGAVATLYPYTGSNHPPTIMTWQSSPGYLVAPASSATLSVTANDAELNPLTYQWSVNSQPVGATATLATPSNATTVANGLSVPGTYIFNINVQDGFNTVSQQVYLVAYAANPPPVLGSAGFRIAPPYGLIFANPGVTTHAIVELPTTSATLQVGISDLANSDFTGSGTWSVVSQPTNANVTLSATTYVFVSIRANVSGMTVPGDYVFQFNLTNTALTAQIICTVNAASSGPVISSVTALPNTLTLPNNTTQFSAVTSDPNSQLLHHWWYVTAAPAGAEPVFNHQGLTNTTVSNLTMPGNYIFTLREFDDIHMTTSNLTLTVNSAPGAPVINSAPTESVIVGTPLTYTITASGSPGGFNATGLPAGFSVNTNSGTISGTPITVGTYNIHLSSINTNGTGDGNLALTVQLPLPVFTSSPTADGIVNTPFFFTVQTTNVATSYATTALPAGLGLNGVSGAITGTPTVAGFYPVTVAATNSTGVTTAPLNIVIYNSSPSVPVITSALSATGMVTAGFNYQIAASNNPTSYFVIGLPSGLAFNPASGLIDGTPNITGIFNVTIRAGNHGGTGSATLQLTINTFTPQPPVITSALTATGTVGAAFSYTITAINNPPSFNAMGLPAGLLVNTATGLISGVPANAGTSSVTLSAINAQGTGTVTLALAVNSAPIPDLAGYWKFDDGSGLMATDSSGNANHGLLTNSPVWTTGKIGGALLFNGSNSCVNVPDAASLHSNQITLSAWINLTNPNATNPPQQSIIAKDNGSQRAFNFKISGGKLQFGVGYTSGSMALSGNTALQSNTWYFAAATYDGTNLNVYLNGALDGTVADSLPGGWNNSQILTIGARNNAAFPLPISGVIDEVRMHTRALSLAEIQALAMTNVTASFTAAPATGGAPLTVTFSDASTGSITNRHWSFGDGTTANLTATNFTHTYNFPGHNTVTLIVSGQTGASTNSQVNLIIPTSTDSVGDGIPDWWRNQYFGNGGQTTNALSCADCDADGTGQDNLTKYLAGLNPTNPASIFQIIGVTKQSNNVLITWQAGAGRTNIVQTSTNLDGSFITISPNVVLPGSGDITTNYLDGGAATNWLPRFYRVRLLP